MPVAILTYIVTWAIVKFLSDVVMRAFLFLGFNMVLGFIVSTVLTGKMGQLSPLNVGDLVSAALMEIDDPGMLWALDYFAVVPAIWTIMNAYTTAMGARLIIGVITGR